MCLCWVPEQRSVICSISRITGSCDFEANKHRAQVNFDSPPKKERKVDSHSKSQVDLTIDLPEMIVSDASNQTGSCFCGVVGLFKAGWCCLIIRLMWMTLAQTVTEVSLVTWSAALCSYSKLTENPSNSCQLWAFQTVQQCIRNVLKTKCHREIDTVFYIARYVRFVYIGLVCLAVCISSLQACIIRNVVHICSQTV